MVPFLAARLDKTLVEMQDTVIMVPFLAARLDKTLVEMQDTITVE